MKVIELLFSEQPHLKKNKMQKSILKESYEI